ncbi:oligosaccharide flippase family protein [Leifsonia sp. fls2-241-R2A-40a]|uniref:lipopolysaccharide biosynthesis protein n=1 Tax=Leifsonia sp. fls2-241-R2A-40a TaxID=3040290 RepID=UPI00254FE82D|nr:oligosaccharide flippase family protein [Leifsonia sp. fls2-241-R2A-40a]
MTHVATRPRSRMATAVGSTAAAKVIVMGISGLLGIVTSRVIIQNFGVAAYAQYGLLTALPALLPFADLGMGAVLINAVASSDDPRRDETLRRTIATTIRVLTMSGLVIVAVCILISLFGLWPTLLGAGLIPGSGSTAALVCGVVFGLALPLAIGPRLLIGLGRNALQVATQAVVAPIIFVLVAGSAMLALPAESAIAVYSFLASAACSILCLLLASRALPRQLGPAVREALHPRRYPGVRVRSTAWPMLVQMIALPIAMQTDRLLLSHLTTGDELAQYNLASQLFNILLATIAASGIALWPIFARARADRTVTSPLRPTLWFTVLGLVGAVLLALIAPLLTSFVSAGRITLDGWLIGGYVVFITLQAAKYPIGMYMTDERGLAFQVWPILVSVPLNLGLSWYLIGVLGAGGPIVGTAISVLLCQVIPNFWWVRRDLARRAALASPGPEVRDSGRLAGQ